MTGGLREPVADRPLDGLVGLAHRREIGLGRDLQVGGAEPRHRDAVGEVGELQREVERLGGVHGRSIREHPDVPMKDGMVGSWPVATT